MGLLKSTVCISVFFPNRLKDKQAKWLLQKARPQTHTTLQIRGCEQVRKQEDDISLKFDSQNGG